VRVVAVIVSFNRSELLRACLLGIAQQTRMVDHLVVVDNASTDDSVQVVSQVAPKAELIRLSENTGGAGGFAVGIAAAMRAGADWIWVMDDDTIPQPGALQALVDTAELSSDDRLVLLGSRAVWTDGTDHLMNTPRQKMFASWAERALAQQVGAIPVRTLSFVSAFIRASRVAQAGLPLADYFLWNDDFEFTARLARNHRAVFVRDSVVEHRTLKKGSSDDDPGERFFFEVRNKVWLMRFSKGFSLGEKCLYSLATARRWIRTNRKSQNRDVLRAMGRRGWAEAWKRSPKANGEVLPGALDDDTLMQTIRELG